MAKSIFNHAVTRKPGHMVEATPGGVMKISTSIRHCFQLCVEIQPTLNFLLLDQSPETVIKKKNPIKSALKLKNQ